MEEALGFFKMPIGLPTPQGTEVVWQGSQWLMMMESMKSDHRVGQHMMFEATFKFIPIDGIGISGAHWNTERNHVPLPSELVAKVINLERENRALAKALGGDLETWRKMQAELKKGS